MRAGWIWRSWLRSTRPADDEHFDGAFGFDQFETELTGEFKRLVVERDVFRVGNVVELACEKRLIDDRSFEEPLKHRGDFWH